MEIRFDRDCVEKNNRWGILNICRTEQNSRTIVSHASTRIGSTLASFLHRLLGGRGGRVDIVISDAAVGHTEIYMFIITERWDSHPITKKKNMTNACKLRAFLMRGRSCSRSCCAEFRATKVSNGLPYAGPELRPELLRPKLLLGPRVSPNFGAKAA